MPIEWPYSWVSTLCASNPAQPALTEKSSALALMAKEEEWFTDDLPLNLQGQRVIEALLGRWIIEAAELSGMRRTDIDSLLIAAARADRVAKGSLRGEPWVEITGLVARIAGVKLAAA